MKLVGSFSAAVFWLLSTAQWSVFAGIGDPDPNFYTGAGPNGYVNAIAVRPDGSILVGGSFGSASDLYSGLIELAPSGARHASFYAALDFTDTTYAMVLQPDGKVVVCHGYAPRINRLNTNGSIDSVFNVGIGINDVAYCIALQGDGKVLIGGGFTNFNGTNCSRLLRLNANGSPDPTFNIGSGPDDWVSAVTVQPDGRILVGGAFNSINGATHPRLVRLNTNGVIDATFDAGTGPSHFPSTISVQSDGKLLIGGDFGSVNGVAQGGIARLSSNGSVDTNFNVSMDGGAISFALQPDGIFFAGWFQHVNGVSRNGLARLTADGALDSSFVPQLSNFIAYGAGGCIALQPDSKILFGGWTGISRLLLANPPVFGTMTRLTNGNAQITGIGPINAHLQFFGSTNLSNWTFLGTLTNSAGTFSFIDTQASSFSRRFYRAVWGP